MRTSNWLADVLFRLITTSNRKTNGRRHSRSPLSRSTAIIESLEPRKMLSASAVGAETIVNTVTDGNQAKPAVARDASGGYVVVWQSQNQIDMFSNYDIFAQRFNAAGTAQGGEFLVNTTTLGNEVKPDVAIDSTGDFIITWQSYNQVSGSSQYDIYARRYNSAGTAQGGEFLVNTVTTNNQNNPSVAMDGNGDFVIAWQSNLVVNYHIYAQRYNAAGTAQGGEFMVSTNTSTPQRFPQVALDSSGDFVVVWQSYSQAGAGSGNDLYGQRYNSSGVTQGTEFSINTFTTNNQELASLAMDANGDFVVAWSSNYEPTNANAQDIYARRFNAAGIAQGGEIVVNSASTTNTQVDPKVTMDAVGDFAVAWTSFYQPGGDSQDIFVQLYNSQGAAQGTEILVNTYTTSNQNLPGIAMDGSGNFVVVWQSFFQTQGSSAEDVYSQRFQANLATAPTVTTPTHTNVGQTTATLGGNVTGNGGSSLTAVGIVVSLTSANANPHIGGAGVTNLTGAAALGVFTRNATGLTAGAGYSFAAYATNSVGTTYSAVSTFTTSINHAPSGTQKTVTTLENQAYVLKAADFGFSDTNDSPPNTLAAVKFTLLPSAGTLKDNNVALVPNQLVSITDINSNKLTFTPNANLYGSALFLAKFQVQDNGGTANGGVNLDPTQRVLYVTITHVNQAPVGTSATLPAVVNAPYTFSAADFGFTDPNDIPANTLLAVKMTLLPNSGTITDNNVAVTANQLISVSDINSGKLVFTPTNNLSGGPYFLAKFQVQDNGGTANGGVNLDSTAKVLNVTLGSVNHAPVGTTGTVTTLMNTPHVFSASDFGFTDPNDSPADALSAVKITLLPNSGTLKNNNVAVTVNQLISVSDINSGKLIFTPNNNLSGSALFLAKFQVQDNGGTAAGGVNLDPSAKVLYVNVLKVNQAPVGTTGTVNGTKNTAYTLKVADFGFSDPNDTPADTLAGVKFTLLPSSGTLTDNGLAVTLNQIVSASDISSNKLVYTPPNGLSGGPFFVAKFQVQDNGGTANGGVNLDPTAKVLDIKLT